MKKLLSLNLIFLCLIGIVNAQDWTTLFTSQASSLQQRRVIDQLYIVNENVVWGICYHGGNSKLPVQEYIKTVNGGTQWTSGVVAFGTMSTTNTSNICPINENIAWISLHTDFGGDSNRIYKTINGGGTWTHQETANFGTTYINFVHFFNENDGVAVGDPSNGPDGGAYHTIFTTTDGGTNWTRIGKSNVPTNLSGEWTIEGIYCVVGNSIWAGTNKGRILYSSNKGATWSLITTPSAAASLWINDVKFVDNNTGFYGTRDNASARFNLYKTTNGGSQWTQIADTNDFVFGRKISIVPGTNNKIIIAVGSNATVYKGRGISYSVNGGQDWNIWVDTLQFFSIDFLNATTGWVGSWVRTPDGSDGIFKYTGSALTVENLTKNTKDFVVFPNPSDGNVTFVVNKCNEKELGIKVFDISGKCVYTFNQYSYGSCFMKEVRLPELEKGVYFAELKKGDEVFVQKLVIR